jgi:hypothetical protein
VAGNEQRRVDCSTARSLAQRVGYEHRMWRCEACRAVAQGTIARDC